MEFSKINKVAGFALNSTVALGYYSPPASNEETFVILQKNIKFEENTERKS
jgi:hypothetical protein